MNTLSIAARLAFADKQLEWDDGSDWRVLAVSSAYVFSAAHNALDDVPGGQRLGDEALTGRAYLASGACDADDASITAADGDTWAGYWIYVDTGVEATSRLIAFLDTRADDIPIGGTVAGGAIDVEWNAAGIFRL